MVRPIWGWWEGTYYTHLCFHSSGHIIGCRPRVTWPKSWFSGPSTRRSSPPHRTSRPKVPIQFRRSKLIWPFLSKLTTSSEAIKSFTDVMPVYSSVAASIRMTTNLLIWRRFIYLWKFSVCQLIVLVCRELMYRCILPKCLWARSSVFILQSELLDLTAIKSWYIGICDIGWSVLSWRDWGNE